MNTIKSYLNIFNMFLKDCTDRHPDIWTKEDMILWIKHNLQKYHWSESYQNSVINALKFYYEQVKSESRSFWEVRPRTPKRLPGTLSRLEIQTLFTSCQNLKHRFILMMIYSCGLRISEMVNLRKRYRPYSIKGLH
ncbi:MAG: phage integrase N-terminal SAM-like domain-containing protein [Saprospiraceae bacterium]|nr:phage integrase N-terminal SAM-like domain-containing protein [Saprospiraceae bacterium]